MNPPFGNTPALTLRQAINAVNADTASTNAAPDTIRFAAGLSGRITLTQGELDIRSCVMIDGPGAANLTIDAQRHSRVFAVVQDPVSAGNNVTLDGLTITGGQATPSDGGGVFSDCGNLTISNCILAGNSARNGGGIFTGRDSGLTVSNCTLTGNFASGDGGGIETNGQLALSNSTLTSNTAGGSGGGIDNVGLLIPQMITNSIISGNSAQFGGGISDGFTDTTLTLSNSTLSGNSADDGGGIFNDADDTLTLTNSTLFGNSAGTCGAIDNIGRATLTSVTVTGNVTAGTSGALLADFLGQLLLHNSIVAGNFLGSPGGAADDLVGQGVSSNSSFNLIGSYDPLSSPAEIINGVNHNLVGVSNLMLGTLADNGGSTPTCAVLPGSPAFGTGDPSLLGTTDQRGVVRVGNVNIGAYQDAPPVSPPPSDGSIYGGWGTNVYHIPPAHPHLPIAARPL
jgi:hypothetical protein